MHKLFEPIYVGGMVLKNRVVMAPAEFNTGDGEWVSERTRAFYGARAKGGVGLIIIGLMSASECHPGWGPRHLGLHDDKFIPGARDLVDSVHAWGGKIAAQVEAPGLPPERPGAPIRLSSSGGTWLADRGLPVELVGPADAPVSATRGREHQRPLTVAEIEELVQLTAEAARRARQAGFDAVDLRLGVGSLAAQFMSPLTNKRTDRYGGDLERRLRYPVELIAAIKRSAGQDCPVLCKMSGSDFLAGGQTIEDSRKAAAILEKAGIAAINVAGGWFTASMPFFQMSVPRGSYAYLAEAIKQSVSIPVMAGYRINDPFTAEEILVQGKADLIAMVRALIADPDFVNKAQEGRFEDIRTCVACCRCFDMAVSGTPVRCTVNPLAGREAEYSVEPAEKPRRVFVVGGGPAGMEAAAVAARRGHDVTLFDIKPVLGGQLRLASVPPHKEELDTLMQHLIDQVGKAGVKVRLGQEVSAGTVKEEKPDIVILATGAQPLIPGFAAAGAGNVVTAAEVLAGEKEAGDAVVVVGGGTVGCEVAEFLAAGGSKVTIVEMLKRIGSDITPSYRWVVMSRLREAGVRMETSARVQEIETGGVWMERGGNRELIPGDTVVLAVGSRPSQDLAESLKNTGLELHVVGDCVEPRLIREALEEAFEVAVSL